MIATIMMALCGPGMQESQPAGPMTVALTAVVPKNGESLRWSPKGEKAALEVRERTLTTRIALGPAGATPIAVVLERSKEAEHVDRAAVDLNRDGSFAETERFTITPKETRGKWWSSFEADVDNPMHGAPGAVRPYALSLWFVEDPKEPGEAPALRWSRRGWHEGMTTIDGRPAFVLITEMTMDGVFDQRDSWAIARDRKALLASSSRSLEEHVWLDQKAYRATAIDPDGRSVTFVPFDPGTTEADEAAKADITKPDRDAPRAAVPMTFSKDLTAALADAKTSRRKILIDFETTWCGPCAQMARFVYPSAAVTDAAKNVLAVKLDGDEARDLVKRFSVGAYPTMILLDPDGTEVRRAVGYQSVKKMVEFLR